MTYIDAKWPGPTPEMLNDPTFNAIWNVIKSWDINVPDAYSGYCGATGNHVRAILDALPASLAERGEERGIRELAARYCYEQARQWRKIPAHDLDGAAAKWERKGDDIAASIVNLAPSPPAAIRAGGSDGH